MKFARYLEDTQIPEWKKAYIDFKGLKQQIAEIRRLDHGTSIHFHDSTQSTPKPVTFRRSLAEDRVYHLPLRHRHGHHGTSGRVPIPPYSSIQALYASLNTLETTFFVHLDHDLGKVDAFYNEQEGIAVAKLSALKDQLRELQEHSRLFYVRQLSRSLSVRSPFQLQKSQETRDESWNMFPRVLSEALGLSAGQNSGSTKVTTTKNNQVSTETAQPREVDGTSRDPSDYQDARRKLKKAFQEFYRGLELLNDYRVQNLTGFRKALKKFEKVTRHPVQDLYMRERVCHTHYSLVEDCVPTEYTPCQIQPRRFAFGGTMDYIMREVEHVFAERFEHGDRKKARRRLKSAFLQKSHHFSTFRSGIYLGLGIPCLILGLYKSYQRETREHVKEWKSLLEIYAGLCIPIVFSLLVGINLTVWSRARINFPFIFEIDVRTAIDTCKYFELPAIIFFGLCFAFCLSFLDIGNSSIAPTTWPAIWMGFMLVVLINPFPILSRSSRVWFLKNFFRLLISWKSRVEFTEFWLADQICSLAFSMGEIYTFSCAYSNDWKGVWEHCSSSEHWPVPFLLTSLPSLIRLVQSIRRYYDSRLPMHLVNAGKYLSSVVAFVVYYIWRVRGARYDHDFVIWCLIATLNSAYTSAWDILMDWSLLSRRFLRPELVYSDNPLMYYFAIISNILIRFIWIIYIPAGNRASRQLRAFIAAIFEMLRRFQWNFYRLENEQLGNTDQYRATREVPLPYRSTRR